MNKFVCFYYLFLLFFFAFFAGGFPDSQDGLQYLTIARRLYYDHALAMPEADFAHDQNVYMNTLPGRDGKRYAITGLGYSLSLLPAVFVEDIFLKFTKLSPIAAFPLQNDWPVLLFASTANSFWAAVLVVLFYKYLRLLDYSHRHSFFLSFIFFISSNLWVYAKHSFPHLMFLFFMTLCFYLFKTNQLSQKRKYLFYLGLSFSCLIITYNPSFLFTIPALGIYYLVLNFKKLNLDLIRKMLADFLVAVLGVLPGVIVYIFYSRLRAGESGVTELVNSAQSIASKFPQPFVIFEGIWGLLFSSGKSIFLFSPLLLLIILFWFKLSKKIAAEIIAFSILFITYVWFIGTYVGGENFLVWHGDESWGPRYVLPILPLALILITQIFVNLNRWQKIFIFLPLCLTGIYIEFLGLVLPYQVRFRYLARDTWINGVQFKVNEYGNFIPRYSPVFNMNRLFWKRIKYRKNIFDHGVYNLRLKDGFDFPFELGYTTWRGLREKSLITFDQNIQEPIVNFSLQTRNHGIVSVASSSANFKFYLNNQEILPLEKTAQILLNQEQEFTFDLKDKKLLAQNNTLKIYSNFAKLKFVDSDKNQALFLQILKINELPQNIVSIDYPYVSPISQKINSINYFYYGGQEKNAWPIWHMHSGVYENTWDFWWLRPFHYWDLPKVFFAMIFALDIWGIFYFGYQTLKFKDV